MGTQNAGKALCAVIGDPGELAAVVVQKARGETYASSGGNIRQGRIVVRTVEIPDLPGIDQSVLDGLQGGRRTAAHHQAASVEILFMDEILPGKRIRSVRDQINAAFKQLMDGNAGDLFRLLFQCEQDIDFIPQKGLDPVFILENRLDLNVAVCF